MTTVISGSYPAINSDSDATVNGLTVGKGTGTTSDPNTALGYQALNATNSGTGRNTAVGYTALNANTSGANNVAVGYVALSSNVSGNENTAVGSRALRLNTGTGNTGVGTYSLDANTSGGSNTAFGNGSLQQNTTASNNTAVGYQAMYSNTTGQSSCAFGTLALYSNTTGTDNTAVGNYETLYSNTTGSSNIAVGRQALRSNTTASRQTALGYQALYASNGQGNVGVGYGAGKDITSGTDNVCIGDLAGFSQGGLTTGAGNVFVGTSAGANNASAGTAANQISIGYNVQCIGDNYFTFGKNTGADRVYNQFTANATWTRSSDERLKTQITENTNCGLAFILDLRTVTYKWKAGADIDATLPDYDPNEKEPEYKEKMYGFIAQEVKLAMDKNGITNFAGWHITPEEQGAIQGVSYEMFVIPLIKAVQELKAEVDSLKAQLNNGA